MLIPYTSHQCFYLQVETVAQFGVIFLLFALGLEFSTAKVCPGITSFSSQTGKDIELQVYLGFNVKCLFFFPFLQLRVVRAVAVLGGLLQIFLFMCLCGVIASVCSRFRVHNFALTNLQTFIKLKKNKKCSFDWYLYFRV